MFPKHQPPRAASPEQVTIPPYQVKKVIVPQYSQRPVSDFKPLPVPESLTMTVKEEEELAALVESSDESISAPPTPKRKPAETPLPVITSTSLETERDRVLKKLNQLEARRTEPKILKSKKKLS